MRGITDRAGMTAEDKLPNLVVVGAAKAGTTSIYAYLREHPEVFMTHPIKEPRFFAYEGGIPAYANVPREWRKSRDVITDLSAYRALFAESDGFKVRGEASTLYLYYPGTAEKMRSYVPDARIVAVLRQPAERAYSHYKMLSALGLEPLSFEDALDDEERRIEANWPPTWHYAAMGRYHGQLQRYLAAYPAEQVKVVLYDDLRADPLRTMQEIFAFIGVDPEFRPDTAARHNETGTPRSRVASGLLRVLRPLRNSVGSILPASAYSATVRRIKRATMVKPAPMTAGTRARLTATYTEDIAALESLIGRDLSAWMDASS